MSGIKKIRMGEREILSIDFSGLKEKQMIDLANESLKVVLEDNHSVFALTTFDSKNFTTPTVMRHFEDVNRQMLHLIKKQGIVGLTPMKKIILKGFNLILARDFKAFDTREEALSYLTQD